MLCVMRRPADWSTGLRMKWVQPNARYKDILTSMQCNVGWLKSAEVKWLARLRGLELTSRRLFNLERRIVNRRRGQW